MGSRSYIFSFERFPWGGVLAAMLVIAIDWYGLGIRGPWETLHAAVPFSEHLAAGITHDRLALRRLVDDPRHRPRAFVVGSSRAGAGFSPNGVQTLFSPVVFAKLAHAGIVPFELRSAVREILSYDPVAVVWPLSEFDTHRPVYIVPAASFDSASAVIDLMREIGTETAWKHRVTLYRLTLASVLDSYRYRTVFGRAGLDRARRFALDRRFFHRRHAKRRPMIPGGRPLPISAVERVGIMGRLQRRFPARRTGVRVEFYQVRSITRGEHARVQMALLKRAFREPRAAGVSMIVVEAPLNPEAAALYDKSIRRDFLDFARNLVAAYGGRFVPLEETGPFVDGDFLDVTHLGQRGRPRLTRAILRAVRDEMTRQDGTNHADQAALSP